MELFAQDRPCITHLESVSFIQSRTGRMEYDGNLRYYELIFKLSGRNHAHFAGHDFDETADAIRYLPKGVGDVRYTVDVLEPGSCIFFCFDTEDPMPMEPLSFVPRNARHLQELFEKLHDAWLFREPGYYPRCMALVYRIVASIQQQNDGYLPSSRQDVLKRSASYLEQHCFDPDFDYEELARRSGVSYSYYKRIFIARYGVPPSRYILSLKMNRARALLLSTPYSVGQIAALLGYEDPAYFSRQFRAETGSSPLQFRQRLPRPE